MKADLGLLWLFGLVLVRASGLMLVAPVLAGQYVPMKIRLLLTVMFSILLCGPLSQETLPKIRTDLLPLTLAFELLIGLLIGMAFRWTMLGVAVAGEIAGLQMGLGIASEIDPSSGMQSNFVQTLYLLLYSALFLALDGHHEMLRAFHASYRTIPPGPGHLNLQCLPELVNQTMAMFIVGIRLAATVLIPLALVTSAMALVSRAFPQANVFVLSYAVSLILGLFLLSTSGPAIQMAVQYGIRQGTHDALSWVQGLVGLQP